ncbi:hypothetical protein SO802_029098 [Lithocarpus litseifolius]|uniref:DUF7026 domain-containing protein n=1 Tax=Lithocarpus litseifolius TaxID=425828 RepID=A0AAW2BVC0_9ROSI
MKWRKMDEEEKWVLVKGFVSDWSMDFHPLSARSVKEMVEECLLEENPSTKSSLSVLFPGLKRLMGFHKTSKEEKSIEDCMYLWVLAARIPNISLILSISQKLADIKLKARPPTQLSAAPDLKAKQSFDVAKALTTPRN